MLVLAGRVADIVFGGAGEDGFVEDGKRGDTVEAEGAIVLAERAPGAEGPGFTPEEKAEWFDSASRFGVVAGLAIGDGNLVPAAHGVAQLAHPGFRLLRDPEARGEQELAVGFVAELRGENGFDTAEGRGGSVCEGVVRPTFDDAGAEAEGLQFFGGEHERRKVKAGLEAVTDTGLAFDGDAGERESLDIAVDSSFRDFQRAGQLRRRHG